MASSPASERRAQLIREMAEDLNRTRQSLGSNSDFADLTGSHLSVDEESSQVYNSQPLPRLPEDTRRSRFTAGRTQDFAIDTSALGRAFPDMTGSGSSIDDGSSISIEIGRGGTRNLSDDGDSKENWRLDNKYKIDLSKLPRRSANSGHRLQDLSTNISKPRDSGAMKSTQYGTSGSSGHSSNEDRRAPPKVTVEDAGDNTGSVRSMSSSQNNTVRSSRFASFRTNDALAVPKRFTSAKDFLQQIDGPTSRTSGGNKLFKNQGDNPTITSTNGGTAQSFMLPNMPNMSELVSGVYDDGTPVFSRSLDSRIPPRHRSPAVKHNAVPSIPVPQEEEAIMLSLQLLQDKVAELEKNKAEAQVAVEELQGRNRNLENEKKELKRLSRKHDNGAGSSGSDADAEGKLGTQQTVGKLQANIRDLRNELEGANRRAAIAEANVKNVAQERDAAVSQLGIAFIAQEELKVENEALKEENKRLRLEVKKYRSAIEAYVQRAEIEKTEKTAKSDTDKSKADDEEHSAQNMADSDCQVLDVDTPKRPSTRRHMSRSDVVRDDEPVIQIPKRRRRRVILEEYTATTDFDGFDDAEQQTERREPTEQISRNVSRNLSRRIVLGENPVSRAQSTKQVREELAKDATHASHVSFLQDGDITMLRKMLEREHLEKRGRIQPNRKGAMASTGNNALDHQDITQLTHHTSRSRGLPGKSSMKDLTGGITNFVDTAVETDEEVNTQHSRAASRRRHSDASVPASKVTRTRMPAVDDMTSAFILPDITMNLRSRRPSQANVDATKAISVAIPEIVINPASHEPDNCTICTRIIDNDPHGQDNQTEINIPQPIPVSDRIHDLALDGEDHTTRPSEPPAQALATVIKALEDEFSHLGMQVSELQEVYNSLDTSLQKRKRKALKDRIDKVQTAMDEKADQIYALYDVLEGQKKSGKLDNMTEQELNETLTSVLGNEANLGNLGMPAGIMFKRGQKTSAADVTPAKERAKPREMSLGQEHKEKSRPTSAAGPRKFPWDESYEDEDDVESLPWEGFDDTMDITKGSRRSNTSSRRRSIGL